MKKAYTLMEVLVVVMIISIIAVLTMPVLLNSMPKRSKAYFRKAYSTLVQAVYEVSNNQFLYQPEFVYQPVLSKPNIPIDTGSPDYERLRTMFGLPSGDTSINDNSFFCYAMASVMNLADAPRCSGDPIPFNSTTLGDYDLITADGTRFYGLKGGFKQTVDAYTLPTKDKDTGKVTDSNPNARFANSTPTFVKDIYIKVKTKKDYPDDTKLSDRYGDVSSRTAKSKTSTYRVHIKATGQIVVIGEPESSYIQEATNVK